VLYYYNITIYFLNSPGGELSPFIIDRLKYKQLYRLKHV